MDACMPCWRADYPSLCVLRHLLLQNQAAALQAPVVATAIASSHLEVVPVAPRLHQLDALLKVGWLVGKRDGGADGGALSGGEGSP